MEALWSIVVGFLVTAGIYLMLERHILRIIFGLIVLSNAINLAIFVGGRLSPGIPPLILKGEVIPPENFANPLPQALILTAIVIGFGLLIFVLALAARLHKDTNIINVDEIRQSEERHDAS